MNKNNLVFLTPKFEYSKFDIIEYRLENNWYQYLKKLGFSPIMITPENWRQNKIIPRFIVITGGGNIYDIEKNLINKSRDDFEVGLIKKYLKKGIKIICICRGFQLFAKQILKLEITRIRGHININHNIYSDRDQLNVNSFHNYGVEDKFNILKILY